MYPLTRQNRMKLARAFRDVPVLDISIDCVIEDQMGDASVDSVENPTVFMIEQDHFFTFFAGDISSDTGKAFLSKVSNGRILMSGPDAWHDVLPDIYGERLMPIKRWHYSSDTLSLEHLKNLAEQSPHTEKITRITAEIAHAGVSYLEIGAFDSPEDFEQRGIGFCMMHEGKSVALAYSSLACSNAIEVSIFVAEDFRRQGVATVLASHLLIWCLEQGLAPHWDAGNPESCGLAEKLAYTGKTEYKAYFLRSS